MEFKSAAEVSDYHRWLETSDKVIFRVPQRGDLSFIVSNYRLKYLGEDISDFDAVRLVREAAGMTAEQLLKLASEHYSVDSYDQSSIGARWPERNTSHSNSPDQLSNMIIEVFNRIEKQNNMAIDCFTGTRRIPSCANSDNLVVARINLGLGVPDLSINVR